MKALSTLIACVAMFITTGARADPLPRLPSRPSNPPSAVLHVPGASASVASAAVPAVGVVNVNTAPPEELVRVPGIGPARADAIVRLRERVTRFRHVDDLLRVRGIGRVTLRDMRPYLTLDGPTTLDARPTRPRLNPRE